MQFALVALVLLSAPPQTDLSARAAELAEAARAQHADGAYEEAASTYVRLSSLPGVDEDAALHQAHLNLELAHARSSGPALLCRAVALARNRLARTTVDRRKAWEETLTDDLAELVRLGGNSACPTTSPEPPEMLEADPPATTSPRLDLPQPTPLPAAPPPHAVERQHRARTAAGATLTGMGIAFAGLMGGALIVFERGLGALHDAGRVPDGYVYPEDQQAALRRLHADTQLAQGTALGLGLASAVTLATGIGLLASRRRLRALALLPSAARLGGGLTLRLRF